MNLKPFRRIERHQKLYYVILYIKLLIMGEKVSMKMDIWHLVALENIRTKLKKDLAKNGKVSYRTIRRAIGLRGYFYDWLLRLIQKHTIPKEYISKAVELAFSRGRIPPKLKKKVKNLVLQTTNIEERQKEVRRICNIVGIDIKPIKVYRCCRVDEDLLNDGEFGYWWSPDPIYSLRMGFRHSTKGSILALYSLETTVDKCVFCATEGGTAEVVLFGITKETPTLKEEGVFLRKEVAIIIHELERISLRLLE